MSMGRSIGKVNVARVPAELDVNSGWPSPLIATEQTSEVGTPLAAKLVGSHAPRRSIAIFSCAGASSASVRIDGRASATSNTIVISVIGDRIIPSLSLASNSHRDKRSICGQAPDRLPRAEDCHTNGRRGVDRHHGRDTMQYRRLGDAGAKLSEIGFGGWLTFGNAVDLERGQVLIDRAFELGINFFDTADAYAKGRCEEAWGELFRGRRRQDYVLATKVFFPLSDNVNDRGLSRKHIFESIDNSLRRLHTDYIDLYQCHRFDEETPLEETVRAMDDLIKQGKVIYWGFSEWPVEQIENSLQICGDRYYKPKGSQPAYSLLARKIEEQVMPLCKHAGIGQVVWSP